MLIDPSRYLETPPFRGNMLYGRHLPSTLIPSPNKTAFIYFPSPANLPRGYPMRCNCHASLFVTVRQLVTPQNTARTGIIVLDWVSIK